MILHRFVPASCTYVLCLVAQSCPTLWDPMNWSPPGSSVRGESPGKNIGVGCHVFLQGSSQSRDGTQVSHIAGRFFLLSKPPRKPKNTRVGSLSILQRIFPTQESNWGLLHGRWILYQLSYQGSPINCIGVLSWILKKCWFLSHVWLFVSPWTIARQAPLSMGFSRQEYWSGLLFPSPGDLPDPGFKPGPPALQADSLLSEPPSDGNLNSQRVIKFLCSWINLPVPIISWCCCCCC